MLLWHPILGSIAQKSEIGLSHFIHRTGIPKRMEHRNADYRRLNIKRPRA